MNPFQWEVPSGKVSLKEQAIKELRWWIDILSAWQSDENSGLESHIFSPEEIMANPSLFHLVQSDASGTDGFGYVHATLADNTNYQFLSKTWGCTLPIHSHDAELRALLDFCISARMPQHSLIMWVSDCEAAVWSINKGNRDDPISRPILANILSSCDHHHCQLFAFWVPREQNQFADYLSHFAYLYNRSEIQEIRK